MDTIEKKEHDRFTLNERHESMRGYFAHALFKEMEKNENIWLVTADLGYGLFDKHFKYFPDRVINTGASEQAASDMCVGLALSNRIPFFYSITPFLVYRCFETWRTYVNNERINVKAIGSGRDQDYHIDGYSHDATDVKQFLDPLKEIKQYYPTDKEFLPKIVSDMIEKEQPMFLSLRR